MGKNNSLPSKQAVRVARDAVGYAAAEEFVDEQGSLDPKLPGVGDDHQLTALHAAADW